MKNGYESKLAKRVAGRANRGLSAGSILIVLAVVATSIALSTAALSLAKAGNAVGPPQTYYVWQGETTYYSVVGDDAIAVDYAVRGMGLKLWAMETPSDTCSHDGTKFTYSMNMKVLRPYDLGGVQLGELILPDSLLVDPSVALAGGITYCTGAGLTLDVIEVDPVVSADATGNTVVTMSMPTQYTYDITVTDPVTGELIVETVTADLPFGEGDSVSITISIDYADVAAEQFEGLTVGEVDWMDALRSNVIDLPWTL